MSRRRMLGITVLDAARRRIEAAYDLFDSPLVCLSGGRDSLVVLDLARREAARRHRPCYAVHVDLEFLPTDQLRVLDALGADPGVHLTRVCPRVVYPRPHLGRWRPYWTWDQSRPHRQSPAGALTDADVADLHDGQSSPMGDLIGGLVRRRHWRGSTVMLRGLRAAESIGRLLTLGKSGGRPRRIRSPGRRHYQPAADPIYDWRESDVARYLREARLHVPAHYRAIHVAGGSMRVLGEPSGLFTGAVRVMDPDLAARFLAAYPEAAEHWRYGATWPDAEPAPRHRATLAGVEALIRERFDPIFHRKMLGYLDEMRRVSARRPRAYPPAYVARRAWHLTWHRPPPLHDADAMTATWWRETEAARTEAR